MAQAKLSALNVPSASRFEVFKSRLSQAQGKKESVKAVEKLCRAENKALRKEFESLTTIRRYYTFYRNICREVISKEALDIGLKIFNLSPKETKSLNGLYAQKVAHEHRNLRPLKHHEKMIVKASELLEAPSLYDRILGISFLTGRRSAEIACTAVFQPLEKDFLLFEGQLKGKTRVKDTYKIPVLGKPDAIVRATMHVREQRPQWVDQPILFHA